MTLDFGQLRTRNTKGVNKRKPGWNKASYDDINNYRNMLGDKLMKMENTEGNVCVDTKCSVDVHVNEIDCKVLDVLTGIVESSYSCIPIIGKDKRIP